MHNCHKRFSLLPKQIYLLEVVMKYWENLKSNGETRSEEINDTLRELRMEEYYKLDEVAPLITDPPPTSFIAL